MIVAALEMSSRKESFSVGNDWWRNVPFRAKAFIPRSDGRIRNHQQALSLILGTSWKHLGTLWFLQAQSEIAKEWRSSPRRPWEAWTLGCPPTNSSFTQPGTSSTHTPLCVQDILSWRQPMWSYGGAGDRRRFRKTSCRKHCWNCLGGREGCLQAETGVRFGNGKM